MRLGPVRRTNSDAVPCPEFAKAPTAGADDRYERKEPIVPRVLVAEDEKDIQFLYTAWLRREGYDVTTADNGLEAITAFEASGFDIVILDVMMPEVDGLEVCRHIRAGDPHVPILMVSALARPDDVERGLQAGASLYVDKPVTPREVILRINEVVAAA
jgi:DNA-binding response OmpR family regulator